MLHSSLINKWEKLGLLEGILDSEEKELMAQLLENQALASLRNEGSKMQNLLIPLARRVWDKLREDSRYTIMDMPAILHGEISVVCEDRRISLDIPELELSDFYSFLGYEVELCRIISEEIVDHLLFIEASNILLYMVPSYISEEEVGQFWVNLRYGVVK